MCLYIVLAAGEVAQFSKSGGRPSCAGAPGCMLSVSYRACLRATRQWAPSIEHIGFYAEIVIGYVSYELHESSHMCIEQLQRAQHTRELVFAGKLAYCRQLSG